MNQIKIAIADDNIFLMNAAVEKLSFFEDLQCRMKAVDGKDLVDQLENNNHIDLILMDIEMPVMNGIEAVSIIKKKFPHIKIIMLTVFDNDQNIYNAIQAGADGYFLKEVKSDELHNGILNTMNGGAAMTPLVATKTLRLLRNPVDFENRDEIETKLTPREVEVLEQLAQSLSYTMIAENLFVSPSTVRRHIENIYAKLQVHSKLEAVQKGRSNNII